MNLIINKVGQLNDRTLRLCLVLSGVLLAIQVNYIQHGWINNDSVLYFEAARLFIEGEWSQAFSLFEWPFYSLLIAGTHMLTGLGIHVSAQLLNVIFFGLATASFLKIIQLSGGDRKVMLSAALILFSSQYIVGDVLAMLLRDQGFWAFFLTSLVFFIRFYQSHSNRDALLWQLSAMVALLFRIEAITYLIALPLIVLFNQPYPVSIRLKTFIKANSLNILIAIVISLLLVFHCLSADYLGRLNEVFTLHLYDQLLQLFQAKSQVMATEVLGKYLDDFATPGLLLTFIYVVIVKSIFSSGLINSALAIMAIRPRLMHAAAMQVLIGVMLIAVVDMFLIITKVFVLSGRYVIPLAWIVMIFASFCLAQLLQYLSGHPENRLKKWLTILLLVIMSLGLVKNILPKSPGYNYEQDAVSWLATNNQRELPVFFDSPRLRYFADAPFIGMGDFLNWKYFQHLVETQQILQYEFLLIHVSVDDPEKQIFIDKNLPAYRELQRFIDSGSNKAIVIYKKTS